MTADVRDPADLAREAERLLSIGAVAEAEALCHRLLTRAPDHPTALMIASVIYMAAQKWQDAEVMLLRGCAAHPGIAGFHAALGRMRLQLNRHAEAVTPLENCVLLDPRERDHRATLVAVYQTRLFATFSPESKQAMLACLADDTLTHSLMNKAWLSLVRLDPEGRDLLALFDQAFDYAAFREAVTPDLLSALQDYQLLQAGLRRFLAADVAIERGLAFTRHWFLENEGQREQFLPLLCALARICFLNEYLFAGGEQWTGARSAVSTTAANVALLACYEPLLGRVPGPEMEAERERWWALSAAPEYRAMLHMLIDEPRTERDIESTIAAVTPIDDEVSLQVQRQYEESPYPRWTTVGSARAQEEAANAPGDQKRILVAGCGTGREAVDAALNFPAARVEGIDLSRRSLAYGIRKAQEMAVSNLSFAQGDILHLGGRPERYDLITASGVLHHMREPRAGLSALLGVLRPGGVLRIGLYSRLARAAIADARRWIATAGYPATPDGIRLFRASVVARDRSDPVRAWLTNSYDFYSLSQCRDLAFHVQEHTFTLPEVAALVRGLSLTVLHVDIKSPAQLARYHAQFPTDPGAVDLTNWDWMEQRHPSLFAGMYSLWLCRAADQRIVDLDWMDQVPVL